MGGLEMESLDRTDICLMLIVVGPCIVNGERQTKSCGCFSLMDWTRPISFTNFCFFGIK